MRASLAATLTALSPSVVEGRLKTQGFGIRGGRAAAAWAEYERLHADFQHQADDNADSQINREFRAAYERQLRDLDDLSQRK
jgi:predicted component of type VI protein secretion system